MSTTRTDGSPSILLLRAWLSMVTRLTVPIDPKNLRMRLTLAPAAMLIGHHYRAFINPADYQRLQWRIGRWSEKPRQREFDTITFVSVLWHLGYYFKMLILYYLYSSTNPMYRR